MLLPGKQSFVLIALFLFAPNIFMFLYFITKKEKYDPRTMEVRNFSLLVLNAYIINIKVLLFIKLCSTIDLVL